MDCIDAIKGQASGKSAYGIDYETIAIGLWALGYSMNDTNKAHLDKAADLMKTTRQARQDRSTASTSPDGQRHELR